jgi:hypothetical protein
MFIGADEFTLNSTDSIVSSLVFARQTLVSFQVCRCRITDELNTNVALKLLRCHVTAYNLYINIYCCFITRTALYSVGKSTLHDR